MVPPNLKPRCTCTRELPCELCSDVASYRIVKPTKAEQKMLAQFEATKTKESKLALPVDSKARKATPVARGFMDYFPAAMAAVAQLSKAGNDKHNPGQDLHHARGKSTDHADCILRHLMDRGEIDPEDNIRHSVKVAWRAMALLQEELEAAGEAPLARGARK